MKIQQSTCICLHQALTQLPASKQSAFASLLRIQLTQVLVTKHNFILFSS